MLFKSKTGQGASSLLIIFFAIMGFAIISLIIVTFGYLLFAIGNDYITLPMYEISTNFNSSTEIQAGFETVTGNYQDTDLSFIDNMWLFGYFVLTVISFLVAYKSRTTNYFSWLSMLTYGLMFVLFIAGFFGMILNWWYNDILLNLFTNLVVSVPFLAYFVLNFEWLLLLHAAALLLVNVMDFDIASIVNRKKKEDSVLDDEIL